MEHDSSKEGYAGILLAKRFHVLDRIRQGIDRMMLKYAIM